MAPHVSDPELLSLHAVRLAGMAPTGAVAARFGLDPDGVAELLLDYEACGWVSYAQFAGTGGWSLTGSGRGEGERRLAAELAACGGAGVVADVHTTFVALNARFLDAVTRWQIRPVPGAPLAGNDHSDFRWDSAVLDALGTLGGDVARLCRQLSDVLVRFDGYDRRYASAMARVERGERRWVDAVGLDSAHAVWFELHEDLVATLGITRGEQG